MRVANYPRLKTLLRCDVAAAWLREDVEDDFFPDPTSFREIESDSTRYLKEREHRLLQFESHPTIMGFVPKKSGMIREAIWLPPVHRILYLAVLHHFLPRLDASLSSACYSYRRDNALDEDAYPFKRRPERWREFENAFREAATEGPGRVVLQTDIASFYDHIPCEMLIQRIEGLLGRRRDEDDGTVLELLRGLLFHWAPDGYGIPQNYDPSSFFGSMYLQPIDEEMLAAGYRYFRWVDDIRVVADSERQALQALHHLQRAMARYRLFLASDKTHILIPGTSKWKALLDVADDVALSEAERLLTVGDASALATLRAVLHDGLERHARPDGDDRKFRAYGNRLLDLKSYREFASPVEVELRTFTLPRLRSHPERSDYWYRFLAGDGDGAVVSELSALLAADGSPFEWQRFHLWRIAVSLPVGTASSLLPVASALRPGSESELVLSAAIAFIGRHGSNALREEVFSRYLGTSSIVIKRAIAVAIQELPQEQRTTLLGRLVRRDPEQTELVQTLLALETPAYGVRQRPQREVRPTPRPVQAPLRRGVGLVSGQRVNFVFSRRDYDYE